VERAGNGALPSSKQFTAIKYEPKIFDFERAGEKERARNGRNAVAKDRRAPARQVGDIRVRAEPVLGAPIIQPASQGGVFHLEQNFFSRIMKTYHHTQSAKTMLAILGVSFCAMLLGTISCHFLVIPMAILWLAGWIFRSLTVEISKNELTWFFGPGFPRKCVALDDIVSAEVTRISFWNGWGIHYTPRGWLYNVSGYGAVCVTLRNGKRFCLGSDEPEVLAGRLAKTQ